METKSVSVSPAGMTSFVAGVSKKLLASVPPSVAAPSKSLFSWTLAFIVLGSRILLATVLLFLAASYFTHSTLNVLLMMRGVETYALAENSSRNYSRSTSYTAQYRFATSSNKEFTGTTGSSKPLSSSTRLRIVYLESHPEYNTPVDGYPWVLLFPVILSIIPGFFFLCLAFYTYLVTNARFNDGRLAGFVLLVAMVTTISCWPNATDRLTSACTAALYAVLPMRALGSFLEDILRTMFFVVFAIPFVGLYLRDRWKGRASESSG